MNFIRITRTIFLETLPVTTVDGDTIVPPQMFFRSPLFSCLKMPACHGTVSTDDLLPLTTRSSGPALALPHATNDHYEISLSSRVDAYYLQLSMLPVWWETNYTKLLFIVHNWYSVQLTCSKLLTDVFFTICFRRTNLLVIVVLTLYFRRHTKLSTPPSLSSCKTQLFFPAMVYFPPRVKHTLRS